MEAFVRKNADYALIKVNINKWGSPVTQQFGINGIPAFRVYDSYSLVAEGEAARNQVYTLVR